MSPKPSKDETATVVPTEEWVRLYIALRRVRQQKTGGLGAPPKIACDILKSWKTRVSQTISVKRKLFILDAEAFNNISPRPEGIDAFLVDPSSVVLPADVLSSETVLIDDGFPRGRLKCPGVLHLEVAVNWTQKDTRDPQSLLDAPASAPSAPAPEPVPLPATASTSSEQAPLVDLAQLAPGPTAPCGNPLKRPERHEPAQDAGEHAAELPQRKVRRQLSETENTLQQLAQGTLAAVRANSWVNANRGEPDTVEFKLRQFLNHARKVCAAIPGGGRQLTPVETEFPMFVCSRLLEARGCEACSISSLEFCSFLNFE